MLDIPWSARRVVAWRPIVVPVLRTRTATTRRSWTRRVLTLMTACAGCRITRPMIRLHACVVGLSGARCLNLALWSSLTIRASWSAFVRRTRAIRLRTFARILASTARVASRILVGTTWSRGVESCRCNERIDVGRLELLQVAALQRRRHRQHPVARADQTAHHQSERFENPPYFAIATFLQHDMIPMIRAVLIAATVGDFLAPCGTVVERDAACQRLRLLIAEPAHDSHCIFPFDFVARMHQSI